MAADDADEVNKSEDKRAEREAFWSNQDKTAARDAKSAAKQKEQSQKVRLADRDERLKEFQNLGKAGRGNKMDGRFENVLILPDARLGIDADEVIKNLDIIATRRGPPGGKPPTKIFKALKKNSGSMAIGIEYKRITGEQEDMEGAALRVFSANLRNSKVDVLLVDLSTPAGISDCEGLVKEQKKASMNFPGPLPIIRTGPTSSLTMVAEAKALGCEGVLISYLNGVNENADELVKACISLALEPLVLISSKQQVDQAKEAGAKIFIIDASSPSYFAMLFGDPQITAKFGATSPWEALRAGIPADLIAVAGLDSRIGGTPLEVETKRAEANEDDPAAFSPKVLQVAAAIKAVEPNKGGFSAIFALSAAHSASVKSERNFCMWLIENMVSKKSSQFSVPTSNLFDVR